jgi:DNA-binding transcriptional MerR regulator
MVEQVVNPQPDDDRGVFAISVAAELVGMGPQTLRLYEARGLLEPARSEGGTRRYSTNDLARLRRIGDLLGAGLNLAGVGMVLDLEAQNKELRVQNTHLRGAGQGPTASGAKPPEAAPPQSDALEGP